MKSPIVKYVVFDIETTGLKKDKNAIIEIAACSFDQDLNDGKSYESGIMSVYDNREIEQRALDSNGITNGQIINGRDPKVVADEFYNYLKGLTAGKNKVVLCGQNSDKFDIPFLNDFFTFFDKDLSEVANSDFTIDTLWLSRVKYPELTNFKLGTLCSENGVELSNAHRAMADTKATMELIKIYIRNLRGLGNTGQKENKPERYRNKFEM